MFGLSELAAGGVDVVAAGVADVSDDIVVAEDFEEGEDTLV